MPDDGIKLDDQLFPGNSYLNVKKSTNDKKIEKVASGHIVEKKKTLKEKFAETFLVVDMKSVANHIFFDVLVPAAKDTISDIIEGTVNMMLFGDRKGGRSYRRDGGRSKIYTSYGDYYDARDRRGSREPDRDPVVRGRSRNIVEDVVFDTKDEAKRVLANLRYLLDKYNVVSVKDYYGVADVKTDFTKDKYGWFNLDDVDVERIREGWVINLPRPVIIDE